MAPPSGKRLKRGDMVTTELTPCVDGYYAQICRTLVVGEANAEQKAAHALWREAMEAGIATVRDGVTAADIAKAENDVFRKHGMGQYTTSEYTRVRGHGMGLFADTKPHHPGGRHHADRRRHGADRASQHLSSGGRLHGAGRRRRGDQGRLRGADRHARANCSALRPEAEPCAAD